MGSKKNNRQIVYCRDLKVYGFVSNVDGDVVEIVSPFAVEKSVSLVAKVSKRLELFNVIYTQIDDIMLVDGQTFDDYSRNKKLIVVYEKDKINIVETDIDLKVNVDNIKSIVNDRNVSEIVFTTSIRDLKHMSKNEFLEILHDICGGIGSLEKSDNILNL